MTCRLENVEGGRVGFKHDGTIPEIRDYILKMRLVDIIAIGGRLTS